MQRISIKYMYTNPPNSKYFKVLYGRRRNEAETETTATPNEKWLKSLWQPESGYF